jgi:glycine/D-amino acid oxidase-like deaminating enzyme
MPLMLEAMKIWSGLAERTAQDVGYRRSGIVFTVAPEEDWCPQRLTDGALKALATRWPLFSRATIAQRWGGLIDISRDVDTLPEPTGRKPGCRSLSLAIHRSAMGPGGLL